MKIHTTLESAITRVHEASAHHYDEIVPVQDKRFDHLERMTVAGKSFEVLPSAQRLLANRLRVPYSYLVRCSIQRRYVSPIQEEMATAFHFDQTQYLLLL